MPFTEKAPAFLFENCMRNDKEWFKANKDIYERELLAPFAQMITVLTPVMNKIDSEIICNPKKVSRIYRDARFTKGGAIFRDSLWCSLCRPKEPFVSVPEFYFYVGAESFGWGCGYYKTPAKIMEIIRTLIAEGDKVAKNAVKAYESQDRFTICGEIYKRDHFPDKPDNLKQWLNRKTIYAGYDGDNPQLLFSENLPQIVADDFESIADIYRLFAKAEDINKSVKK